MNLPNPEDSKKFLRDLYDKGQCGWCKRVIPDLEKRIVITLLVHRADETFAMIRTCSAFCAVQYITKFNDLAQQLLCSK